MSAWGRHFAKASFFAMAVALPRDAAADTHSHCPEIWSEYVEVVRDILASSERETQSALFIGTEGDTLKCWVQKATGNELDRFEWSSL